MLEPLDDFIQKPADDEPLSSGRRNSASPQIEKFVLINLPRGSAMRATHVIRQNFETRHRVGLGIVAQKKIAHLLISIGKMSVRFDSNQSAKDAAGMPIERVFIK